MGKKIFILLLVLLMALVALPACTQPTVPTPTTPPEVKPPSVTTPTTEPESGTAPEPVTTPAAEPEPAEEKPPLEGIEKAPPPGEEEAPPPEEVEPVGELLAEQTVSAIRGGTVTADDGGITVKFPPFSLNEDTNIQVRVLSEADLADGALPPDLVGEVYSLEPDGLEFIKPAVITLSLDREDLSVLDVEDGYHPAILLLTRSSDGVWEILDNVTTEVDMNTGEVLVSGETSHFSNIYRSGSGFQAMIEPKAASGAPGDSWTGQVTVLSHWGDTDVTKIRYFARPVEVVKRTGAEEAPGFSPPANAKTPVSPNTQYKCIGKQGEGFYGVVITYRVSPTFEEVFQKGIGMDETFREDDPSHIYEMTIAIGGQCTCKLVRCFAEDTLVLMADDSLKRISEIQAGELVKTYDTGTGEVMIADVVVTGSGEADHYYLINGDLKVTPPHPFFTAEGQWVKIADLKAGDEIRSVQGLVEITSIERVNSGQRIFNISVRDYHNFFVSANGEDFYLVKEGP